MQGARFALGPVNEEADFDELLVASSRAIGAALEADSIFECTHCRRAISIATDAQRQMSPMCCSEQPRLLRIHETSRVDIEMQLTNADITLRPPAALAHGLASFVDAYAFQNWKVRDVGAVRMSVQVSVERGEAFQNPPNQPQSFEQDRSASARWWSPGAWMRKDGQTAGVPRVSAGARIEEARGEIDTSLS